jgi:tRNA G10  N-methylase Trm11
MTNFNIKLGDRFELGNHILVCGDCTDAALVSDVLGKKRIALILTDPPYGIAYVEGKEGFRKAKTAHTAIHARPSIRHKRLSNRPDRPLTRQEAEERDWAQLTRLTQGTPIALADFMIVNEGEISELHAALDRAVGRIGQS